MPASTTVCPGDESAPGQLKLRKIIKRRTHFLHRLAPIWRGFWQKKCVAALKLAHSLASLCAMDAQVRQEAPRRLKGARVAAKGGQKCAARGQSAPATSLASPVCVWSWRRALGGAGGAPHACGARPLGATGKDSGRRLLIGCTNRASGRAPPQQ